MKDTHLTLRLPEDLAKALDRLADERGVGRSALVREAVTRYLASPAEPDAPKGITGAEFARIWRDRPRLAPGDAEAFERDIREVFDAMPPNRDPWA